MGRQTLAATSTIKLAGEVTRVPLVAPAQAAALRRKLAEVTGRAVYLVLDDLQATEAPTTVYEIYLGLPDGATPQPDDPHYVGTLNFFAVAPPNTQRRARSYDVTAMVRSLLSRDGGDNLAVTIVGRNPGGEAAAAPPAIGSVALVAQ